MSIWDVLLSEEDKKNADEIEKAGLEQLQELLDWTNLDSAEKEANAAVEELNKAKPFLTIMGADTVNPCMQDLASLLFLAPLIDKLTRALKLTFYYGYYKGIAYQNNSKPEEK